MESSPAPARQVFSPFYEAPREAEPLWQIGEHQIVRCAASGFVFLANPPGEDRLREFYSAGYFEGDPARKGYPSYLAEEPTLRANFRERLRAIARGLAAEGRDPRSLALADIGCAYGFFLDEARSVLGSVRGVELSEEAAALARARFGLVVDSAPDALARLAPESLDVVTMWDTIEHVARPRSALLACARALRPGGRIFLTTGDIGSPLARLMGRHWRLVNPPQHISYFSRNTISALLSDCGFEVEEVRHPGRRVSLAFAGYILRYLLGRETPRPSAKPSWLSRRSVRVNLFDVVWVRARKRGATAPSP